MDKMTIHQFKYNMSLRKSIRMMKDARNDGMKKLNKIISGNQDV